MSDVALLKEAFKTFTQHAQTKLSNEKKAKEKVKNIIQEKAKVLIPITDLLEGLKMYRLVVSHQARFLPTNIQINLEGQKKVHDTENVIAQLSKQSTNSAQKELDEKQERFISNMNLNKKDKDKVVPFSYSTMDYTEANSSANSPTKVIVIEHPCTIHIYALLNDQRGDVLIRVNETKCAGASMLSGYKSIKGATLALAQFFGKHAVFFLDEQKKNDFL